MNYQIFNEDCLEGMKKIADGSVDMILTDLPYGITGCAFDKRIPFEPMWEQFKRVTKKNAAICLFSQMPFGAELIMSNRKMFRYEWIWEKSLGVGFFNANKMPMRCHENILVFYRALPTYNPQMWQGEPLTKRQASRESLNYRSNGKLADYVYVNETGERYPRDVIKFNTVRVLWGKGEMYHPQQKPTDLLECLIKTYTDEGETVLDATMGSGSTGVACVNTNRNFIGFELEENFFNITQKRIAEAVAKREQSLF